MSLVNNIYKIVSINYRLLLKITKILIILVITKIGNIKKEEIFEWIIIIFANKKVSSILRLIYILKR